MKRLALLLECVLCRSVFNTDDVASNAYYPETQVCRKCYKEMKHSDSKLSCFGKRAKKHSPGYSKGNIACTSLCPDRRVCATFLPTKQKE